MDAKQHLYLVDGSAYIFRAYHRLPPLTNPRGTPVGERLAAYGLNEIEHERVVAVIFGDGARE